MLLKIKNKMLLSMEKMIKEARDRGGVPDSILFEPKEAKDFLIELKVANPIIIKENIKIEYAENPDVDIRFFLKPELTNDRLLLLVSQWYKKEFSIFYKNIKLKVIRKEKPNVTEPKLKAPPKPKPSLSRILKVGSIGNCEKCGSSLHRKWLVIVDGCLQPECENYYKK